jgi:hypothetical protein
MMMIKNNHYLDNTFSIQDLIEINKGMLSKIVYIG